MADIDVNATLEEYNGCLLEANADDIIEHIADMTMKLRPYETFVTDLGIGTIVVERLVNAYRLSINYHDSDKEDDEIYCVTRFWLHRNNVLSILTKFIKQELEENNHEYR